MQRRPVFLICSYTQLRIWKWSLRCHRLHGSCSHINTSVLGHRVRTPPTEDVSVLLVLLVLQRATNRRSLAPLQKTISHEPAVQSIQLLFVGLPRTVAVIPGRLLRVPRKWPAKQGEAASTQSDSIQGRSLSCRLWEGWGKVPQLYSARYRKVHSLYWFHIGSTPTSPSRMGDCFSCLQIHTPAAQI